jgi:hypothetical protein
MTKQARGRWSRAVTERSDALDLRAGVFTWKDPKRIAASLKRSAENSRRRKADPFRSALSMLTFYVNRAGKNLPASRRRVLTKAKDELRRQFGRE